MEESEVQSESTNDTSVVEEVSSQETPSEAEVQSAPEKPQEEKPAPFHEHPRFQELIEQNRAAKQQLEEYRQALDRLQYQTETLRRESLPKQEKPEDPFVAELKKVNPEFAKSFQTVAEQAARTQELEKRLQQYEQQQFAEKAVNHFKNLLDTNKVSDSWDRKIYERAVRAEVYDREARGEKLGIKDLEGIFKSFHDEYAKAKEESNRKITASYVQEKSKDKTPKGATGGVASTTSAKKIGGNDIASQAKWLASQIRDMKKEH